MKKIEAATLEEAYEKACGEFGCSISELKYEVIQYPSGGFFGFFSKKAIIVAVKSSDHSEKKQLRSTPKERKTHGSHFAKTNVKDQAGGKDAAKNRDDSGSRNRDSISENKILESFFAENGEEESGIAKKDSNEPISHPDANPELRHLIEENIKRLIDSSCFDIDTVEVDVIGDTAYIFIDGSDAALIIGKEGYRYNALSYLLFNWLHGKYGLYIKLEIAQFLSSQQEMIRNYIQPVIEHVGKEGWGRTKPLDGVLAQIALEQLRNEFPDKYVAIKRHRDGSRYVLINDFSKRK